MVEPGQASRLVIGEDGTLSALATGRTRENAGGARHGECDASTNAVHVARFLPMGAGRARVRHLLEQAKAHGC